MASIHHERKHGRYRVSYTIHQPAASPPGNRYRSRYTRGRPEAADLRRQLEALETATRTGLAPVDQIQEWVHRGWLRSQEAAVAFRAYREAGEPGAGRATDLGALRAAYENYALEHSKAKSPFRKTHQNQLAVADQVLAWLAARHPTLDLETADVETWIQELSRGLAEWTVHHRLTMLRLLLDQAVRFGMVTTNVARQAKLPVPRRRTVRRILTVEEAGQLLDASLRPEHREPISGGLPTVVRLGLYAGLRDEEMAQCRWTWLDIQRRILTVQANLITDGELAGQVDWEPKDAEARRLDVKAELVVYLLGERRRQEGAGLLGPYVIVAGHARKWQFRGKPITTAAMQKAFRDLVRVERMDRRVTIYSLRHTYCTALLRAGVDVRTVQARMGHADLKTTLVYLHALEPEAHPTDALPY